MIKIFEKRGRWCYRDSQGKLFKFDTEEAAKSSLGLETFDNGSQKEENNDEEENNEAQNYFQASHSKTSIGISEEDTESESEE